YLKTVGRQRQPLNIHEGQRARVPLFGEAEHALRTIDADDDGARSRQLDCWQRRASACANVEDVAGLGGQREAGDQTLANRPDDGTPQSVIGLGALRVAVSQHRRLLTRCQVGPLHRSAVELLTPSDSTPFPASAHSGSPSVRYRAEKPCPRRVRTASGAKAQYGPRQ